MSVYSTPDPAAYAPSNQNSAGRVSLAIAIVIVLVSLIQQVVSYSLPLIMSNLDFEYSSVTVVFGAFSAVSGLLAFAGLVFGILGLTKFGLPKGAAAAGTAIAASTLLAVTVGLIGPLIVQVLY